ncbi:syntaxin-binding protein 4 isoform X2 [Paramormyrops kingsleyae]|uniref:Syntaxin binding protein 4 n=2 Tax=Paramormyrops kingsleyae TaxID=1676925 RepID=A0A3B3SFT4_9TELE|nr:syntaxin-binding protein 4 isoform X2 [Paramormyrops kingsleyae]XP_023678425.1 syntaxin-binding protein 4 isoform X2 [Paramormyrops kingsleyae]
MGPHGINRAVQRVEFSDCKNGLGVKIIGGYRELTGEEYGIYIKRILPCGIAAQDGRLKTGDLILDVNNMGLGGATNERAVEILRMASASNHMSLLIVRDDESRKEFLELIGKYGCTSSTGCGMISPTQFSAGKLTDTASSSSSSRSTSPLLQSPKEAGCVGGGTAPSAPILPQAFNDAAIQLICVAKGTGLGLVIRGGANRAEGPMVYIQDIVPGGDCHKDGRLKAGDQLISINKESFIGATYEEARSLLSRTKLRPDPTTEIVFIRQRSSLSPGNSPQSPISLQPALCGDGQSLRPTGLGLLSQSGNLVRRVSCAPCPGSQTLPSVQLSQVRSFPPGKEKPSAAQPDNTTAAYTCPDAVSASHTPTSSAPRMGFSLSSSSFLKLDNLVQALGSLGIKLTEEQRQTLKERLSSDSTGPAAPEDREDDTKELVESQIDASTLGQEASSVASDNLPSLSKSSGEQPFNSSDSDELEEMERLRKEHTEALKKIKKLQDALVESANHQHKMQEEMKKVKQEAKAAGDETRALRTRIHLAEAAQKQARGMEIDYEEVIQLLEAEIAEMKAQITDQPAHVKVETQDFKKGIAALECQLHKSENPKKGFEVSTWKLLHFVEIIQDFLSDSQVSQKNYRSANDAKLGQSQAPASCPTKKTPWNAAALAEEAKELTRSVRAILEVDCK